MALFELAAVAGGLAVGNQWPNLVSLVRGKPSRSSTGKEVLLRTGSGGVAGLGLATKSLTLTVAGAGGVVFTPQLARILRLTSKASAQQTLEPTIRKIGRPDFSKIARQNIGLRPPMEAAFKIGAVAKPVPPPVKFRPPRPPVLPKRRIPALREPDPPTERALVPRSDALLMAQKKIVLDGQRPFSRLEKLGMISVRRKPMIARRGAKGGKRRRRLRNNRRRLRRDKSLQAVVPTAPRPLVGRIDLVRRPAFG